jgi:hypothetical protein
VNEALKTPNFQVIHTGGDVGLLIPLQPSGIFCAVGKCFAVRAVRGRLPHTLTYSFVPSPPAGGTVSALEES